MEALVEAAGRLPPDQVAAFVIMAVVVAAGCVVGVAAACVRPPAAGAVVGRWTSPLPHKAWVERYYLAVAPVWIGILAVVIVTRAFETFTPAHYFWVCAAIVALPAASPLLAPVGGVEADAPWWARHAFKSHVWLAILTFVGSYFWTHYFESLLGAYYTFQAWRFNDVPIAMYLAAHAYFTLYHTATNMALRRWYTSPTYAALPRPLATTGTWVLVAVMSWVTSIMEAFTIQGFPYYHIEDRSHMYTVGAVVYGIYFIVSFPMYYRLDEPEEEEGEAAAAAAIAVARSKKSDVPPPPSALAPAAGAAGWTLSRTTIDALGATMAVTIMLDFWRLAVLAMKAPPGSTTPAPGLAWASSALGSHAAA